MTSITLIGIWGAIIATAGLVFAMTKYILSTKVKPLEDSLKEIKNKLDKSDEKIAIATQPMWDELNKIRDDLLKEVRKISEDNYQFRISYEKDISEIKLMLAQKYISKDDCQEHRNDCSSKIKL